MKIGIVASSRGWYVQELERAFNRRGHNTTLFPISRLVAGIGIDSAVRYDTYRMEDCDALIIRSLPAGSLEQVIFRMDVLHRLKAFNIPILNHPRAIEKTVDKYYTSFLLADNGIPTPPTLITERFDQAMQAFTALGKDVVVKPIFGSEGRGIVRVCSEDEAYRVFRALEMGRYVFYLQKFIEHGNWDIRTFVIDGTVVAGMIRRGNTWKTNVAQGAQAEPLELNEVMLRLSIEAVEAIGADYGSVDILRDKDGEYFVHEVNSIPGWKGLERVNTISIAECLVDYVERLVTGTTNSTCNALQSRKSD